MTDKPKLTDEQITELTGALACYDMALACMKGNQDNPNLKPETLKFLDTSIQFIEFQIKSIKSMIEGAQFEKTTITEN